MIRVTVALEEREVAGLLALMRGIDAQRFSAALAAAVPEDAMAPATAAWLFMRRALAAAVPADVAANANDVPGSVTHYVAGMGR